MGQGKSGDNRGGGSIYQPDALLVGRPTNSIKTVTVKH